MTPDLQNFEDETKINKLNPNVFNTITECIFLLDLLNYELNGIQRISIFITLSDLTSIKGNDTNIIHLDTKKNIKYDYDTQKLNVLSIIIKNNYNVWYKTIFNTHNKSELIKGMPFNYVRFLVNKTSCKMHSVDNYLFVKLDEKAFYKFLTHLYLNNLIQKENKIFFSLFFNKCFLNYKIDTIVNSDNICISNKSIEWHYFNNKNNLLERQDYEQQILVIKGKTKYIDIDIHKQIEKILSNIINYCSYNSVLKNVAIIDDLIINHADCFNIINKSNIQDKPLIILYLVKKLIEFEKYTIVKNIIMRSQKTFSISHEESYDIAMLIIYDLLLTKYKDQEILDSLYNYDNTFNYKYQISNVKLIHISNDDYNEIIAFYDNYNFNITFVDIDNYDKNKNLKFYLPCLSLYLKHDKITPKYLYKIYTTSNLTFINSIVKNYNILPDYELLTKLCIFHNHYAYRHIKEQDINVIKSIFSYKIFPQNDIINIIYNESNKYLNKQIALLLLDNGLSITKDNCVLLLHCGAIEYNDLLSHNIDFNENIYYNCYEKNALLYNSNDIDNISPIFKLRSLCIENPRNRATKTKNKNNFIKLIKDKKILPDRYCYEFACYSRNTDIIEIFEKLKCVPTVKSIYYTLTKSYTEPLKDENYYTDTKIIYIIRSAKNIQTQEYMTKPYSEFENIDNF